jgi:(2Fe-2S) ferredoxin
VELYRRLKDRVRELGLRDEVIVTRTGCLKHCSRGATVGVWPQNRWYGGVTPGDVEEILLASVASGHRIVERLALPQDAAFE